MKIIFLTIKFFMFTAIVMVFIYYFSIISFAETNKDIEVDNINKYNSFALESNLSEQEILNNINGVSIIVDDTPQVLNDNLIMNKSEDINIDQKYAEKQQSKFNLFRWLADLL